MDIANKEDVAFLRKSASLCEQVGTLTEKLASLEADRAALERQVNDFGRRSAAFVKRATEAAKVFSRRGVIASDAVNTYADQAAADPCSVFGPLMKMAETLPATDMGGASADFASRNAHDPNSKWLELGLGTSRSGEGYVD